MKNEFIFSYSCTMLRKIENYCIYTSCMSWLSHRIIRNETLLSKSMFSSRKFYTSNLQKRIQGQRWGEGGWGEWALIDCARKSSVICYLHCLSISKIVPIIMSVFVNHAHCSQICRNYASTFYFKFGNDTSITMHQTGKWKTHLPYLHLQT